MRVSLRYAIIGCGGISKAHMSALQTLKAEGNNIIDLVAVCDVDRNKAEKYAQKAEERLGLKPDVYTDYHELLKRTDIEAVGVNVWHAMHHVISTDAMRAGKHVMTEKPIAITPTYGRALIETAKETGVVFAVAEQYRRSPENRAIKAAIADGLIGKPYLAIQQFASVGSNVFCMTPWRHRKALCGPGPIFDNGVHDSDLFLYWIGEIDEISALSNTFEKYRQSGDVSVEPTNDDTDIAVIRFADGTLGQWMCSWAGHGRPFGQIAIYGSKGSINLPLEITLDDGTKITRNELVARYAPGVRGDAIADELEDFARCVKNGGTPEIDGLMGLRAICVSFAAMESAFIGKPVKVSDIMNGNAHAYEDTVMQLVKQGAI